MSTPGETTAYRLRNRGSVLEVETSVTGGRNHAALRVDGELAQEESGDEIGHVDLRQGPHVVRVSWWWKGRVGGVELLEPPERSAGSDRSDDDDDVEEHLPLGRRPLRTPFEPPADSRAYRAYRFRTDHPTLYAARHVLVQVAGTLFAIFGIGALVSGLFRWLPDLPDLSVPDWVLGVRDWVRDVVPDVNLFGWVPDLFGWVPDIELFGWVPDWLGSAWPIVLAVLVGLGEVDRRRKRDAREREIEERERGENR